MADRNPIQETRNLLQKEPGWDYGTVLPLRVGPEDQVELTVPTVLRDVGHGLLDLIEGPDRAKAYLAGAGNETGTEMRPTDVVTPNALMSIVGTGMAAGATTVPRGALGTFAGRRAATADLSALEKTRQAAFETENPSWWQKNRPFSEPPNPDKVAEANWKKFGWNEGGQFADKQPRFEIPDAEAKLRHYKGAITEAGATGGPTVGQFLYHPELFKAYPDLQNIPVRTAKGQNFTAAWEPNNRQVLLGDKFFQLPMAEQRRTLLHELQHGIQQKEGFARGGNPQEFMRPDWSSDWYWAHKNRDAISQQQLREEYMKALGQYKTLAGEVESRLVEDRSLAPAAGLRQTPPWRMMDVPPSLQIVKPQEPSLASWQLQLVQGNPFK